MEGRETWVCGEFRGRGVGFEREDEKEDRLVAAIEEGNGSLEKRDKRESFTRWRGLRSFESFLPLWVVLGFI